MARLTDVELVGPGVNDGIAVEIIHGGHEAILEASAPRSQARAEALLAFAKQAGAAPPDATKESHPERAMSACR